MIHERRSGGGFTLVEVLVAMSLFALLAIGFYSVMLAGVRNSDTTESIVDISEEARFGFNRMVRDTREALRIVNVVLNPADPTASVSYTIEVDFNLDGDIDTDEIETFAYDAATDEITLNGEVLMEGVTPVPGSSVFDFSSNLLQFESDSSRDGVATWREIDRPPAARTDGGNANDVLDGPELPYITNVTYAFEVASGDREAEFYSEAQLRNLRIERDA